MSNLEQILKELGQLNLERTGIQARIDGLTTLVRNLRSGTLEPTPETLDDLLSQIEQTQTRLAENKKSILKLKEKFDQLDENL